MLIDINQYCLAYRFEGIFLLLGYKLALAFRGELILDGNENYFLEIFLYCVIHCIHHAILIYGPDYIYASHKLKYYRWCLNIYYGCRYRWHKTIIVMKGQDKDYSINAWIIGTVPGRIHRAGPDMPDAGEVSIMRSAQLR